jgi:predicted glycosyltransferase
LDFGEKHVRFRGYKELAYLHPNYFKPDETVYDELGLARGDRYVILRFNALNAIHDGGVHGFTVSDKLRLVNEFEKYARVFIAPEAGLPEELESRRLRIPYDRIHHALYYAQLLVADSGTICAEGAILGTPTILCNTAYNNFGVFSELDRRYGLLFNYTNSVEAIEKAVALLQQPGLKEEWAAKRRRLMDESDDVSRFVVDCITDASGGLRRIRSERDKAARAGSNGGHS